MPASEFKSSCFNTVYGVKRKASVEDAMEVWSSDMKVLLYDSVCIAPFRSECELIHIPCSSFSVMIVLVGYDTDHMLA